MNNLFEVTFSVGNDSSTQWVTTQISAFLAQQAQALVEAQYGGANNCHVWSVRQIS
jgi:PleD family two-component response regulator